MKKISLLLAALIINVLSFAQAKSIDDLVTEGNDQYDKGDYMSAIALYRQALAIDSNSPRANYELANTNIALKKYPEACAYADKVINHNEKFVDQAYTLKGTALDLQDKYDEALQTYLEGIKRFPDNYLLQYNTAFTYYNQKQYKEAGAHSLKAIQSNPNHPSSNLLLAECMYHDGKRVQSLLGLFYFLLLENNSKRAEGAFNLINKQMGMGVSKEGENTININIATPDDKDEFQSANLMLSMSQALKYDDKNKAKTEGELFYDQVKLLFDVLGEQKEKTKAKSVWSDVYVPFFKDLNKSGNTETFCYYISLAGGTDAPGVWLKANPDKLTKFAEWYKNYGN